MCNLSQGFVDMGRKEGRKEGRALGHAEGRAEQAKFTNSQMKTAGMTIDQRSKMLGLSVETLSSWDKESVNN